MRLRLYFKYQPADARCNNLTYSYTAVVLFVFVYRKDDSKLYCLLVEAKEQYNVLLFWDKKLKSSRIFTFFPLSGKT